MPNHRQIFFPHQPGFADIPDSDLAVDDYVVGAQMARMIENAAFGMVKTEIFYGSYFNGDTVDLPVSSVDGYQYSRDELCYCWGATSTGQGKTGWNSYNGMIWFMQFFVDPGTGKVTTEVWYTGTVDGKKTQQTNDGILFVWILATRKKNALVMGAQPYFQDHSDADLATDKALGTTLAKDINNSAKFGCVSSEAIYMGTYKNGQQIARPVSPVDGYEYAYDEVKFKYSLVWTTDGDTYEAPSLPFYACLNRIQLSVDSTGNVTTYVDYHNVPDGPVRVLANAGRVAIVALCTRGSGYSGSDTLDYFSWLDASKLLAGSTVDTDLCKQLMKNIREATTRPEIIDAGVFNCGDIVGLPTSAIDGYTYSRNELNYLWEIADSNTGPNPRLYNWWILVALSDDPAHGWSAGQVIQKMSRVPFGDVGSDGVATPLDDTDFSVHVWIVAVRQNRRQKAYGEGTGDAQSGNGGSGGGIVESGGVSSVSAGNLAPLFTTTVLNPTTTPEIDFEADVTSGDAGKFLSNDGTNLVWSTPGGGGIVSSDVAFADNEVVSGSGTGWTLAQTPSPSGSLKLYQKLSGFGWVLLFDGVGKDYTISGNAITTTNSLSAGDLRAWYTYTISVTDVNDETVSGSGTSWTLAGTPDPIDSLELYQSLPGFGSILLIEGAGKDYTLSGTTITTTNSLTSGSLRAWYKAVTSLVFTPVNNEIVTGSGTSFSLVHIPTPVGSLRLFQYLPGFGLILLVKGTDYTISGSTISTTNSIPSGSLRAWYRY